LIFLIISPLGLELLNLIAGYDVGAEEQELVVSKKNGNKNIINFFIFIA